MFPSIPNKLPQLLVVIGLAILIYSFISYDNLASKVNDIKYTADPMQLKMDRNENITDSLRFSLALKRLDNSYTLDSLQLKKTGDSISIEYLKKLVALEKKYADMEAILFDSSLNKDYSKGVFLRNNIKILEEYNSKYRLYIFFGLFGLIIFVIGIISWFSNEKFERNLSLRTNFDKPIIHKNCQSCGRILNSIVKNGTEADGKLNFSFCVKCYSNGSFRQKNLKHSDILIRIWRAKKRKTHSKWKLVRKIEDYFYYTLVVNKIRALQRWNKNRYITLSEELFYVSTLAVIVVALFYFVIFLLFR